LTAPPVKEYALGRGIPVYQPVKIKTPEALGDFASHGAEAAVVVAYGRILPPAFLRTPPRGCVNVHFSLLPKYRGAAPVNWAVVRGERETGVTTMLMDEGLDTGPILLQRATEIGAEEAAPELMNRLAVMGADLLSETLARLGQLEPRTQSESGVSFAPILSRDDGRIDWSRSATDIERAVRGFQPWPNAHTTLAHRRLVVWRAAVAADEKSDRTDGAILAARGDDLKIACGAGSVLRLLEVQPETKRRMLVRDFLNGASLRPGDRFE
jgi:methionyl-tRNA formyltransferase